MKHKTELRPEYDLVKGTWTDLTDHELWELWNEIRKRGHELELPKNYNLDCEFFTHHIMHITEKGDVGSGAFDVDFNNPIHVVVWASHSTREEREKFGYKSTVAVETATSMANVDFDFYGVREELLNRRNAN